MQLHMPEREHTHMAACPATGKDALTVDGEEDGGLSARIEVCVLGQAGVGARLSPGDLGYHVLLAGVNLGAVVKPDVVAGRVGRGQAGQDHLLLLIS